MTLRASALALVAASSLFVPALAEAKHRHSRSCGHYDGYWDRGDRYDGYHGRRYDRHRGRGYGHYPRYGHRYYAPPPAYFYYDDDYGYYPRYRYYREPAVSLHFHSGHACRRAHVGLHFGF